jgi:hypothetical protein
MIARGKALKKEGAPIESSGMRIAPAIATFDSKPLVASNLRFYSMYQPWLTISD